MGRIDCTSIGYKKLEFVNCYFDNIGKQNIEAIEDNLISRAIVKCLNSFEQEGKEPVIEGSPLEVLEMLEIYSEQNGGNPKDKRWPTVANVFTRRLKQIQSSLLEGLGIEILISRNTKRNEKTANTSFVKIWKASLDPENTSNISISPTSDNSSVENEKNVGDTIDIEKTQISPTFENTSNTNTNDNAINETSLDENSFRQLINRSGPNNIYYQCSLHPRVESIYPQEILRHCLLKPEEHKAELLRLLKEDGNDKGAGN